MSAHKLYTPELLGLAVELASWPLDEALPQIGEARSATCGSTLKMSLALDHEGRIARLGMRVRACAIGQAAAAIFARHGVGRDLADLESVLAAAKTWLSGDGDLPDWPDLAPIVPARQFPARHGAILLPWEAAVSALSTTVRAS